jgi:muconolactone D-isomerase
MTQKDLFTIWSKEADAALKAKSQGVVVDLWKCVGTRRVIAILDVDSPDSLDRILLDLPIMKEMGQHVQVQVTPLRKYEDFAADLKARLN